MSVKAALAKLSATAAGGALVAGGAVHVAERPVTDSPSYKSKSVKQIKARPIKRATPKPPVRAARVIPKRVIECVPYDSPEAAVADPENVCPPIRRVVMAPVPVPPLPQAAPVAGGGG